jgi:hypothetical protein
MLRLKIQFLGHVMWRADSLEKTLMQRKIEGKRRSNWPDHFFPAQLLRVHISCLPEGVRH